MRSFDASGNLTSRVNSRGSRISWSIGSLNSIVGLWFDDDFAAHAGPVVEETSEQEGSGLPCDEGPGLLLGREIARTPTPAADGAGRVERVVRPTGIVDERGRVYERRSRVVVGVVVDEHDAVSDVHPDETRPDPDRRSCLDR